MSGKSAESLCHLQQLSVIRGSREHTVRHKQSDVLLCAGLEEKMYFRHKGFMVVLW